VAVPRLYRWFLMFVLLLAGLGKGSLAGVPLSAQEREQASLAVTRTVLGILSFVRWPKPSEHLTLCVAGEVQFASLLTDDLRQSNGQALRVQRYDRADALPLDCNALYLGKLPAATEQALFARFFGRPTLLISEADAECALGNMFCLAVAKKQVNFKINLDSLSRSTLRVHPNVLKLAKERL